MKQGLKTREVREAFESREAALRRELAECAEALETLCEELEWVSTSDPVFLATDISLLLQRAELQRPELQAARDALGSARSVFGRFEESWSNMSLEAAGEAEALRELLDESQHAGPAPRMFN